MAAIVIKLTHYRILWAACCDLTNAPCGQSFFGRVAFPTEGERGPNRTLDRIIPGGRDLVRSASGEPVAVGISVGAPFDPEVGEIDSQP
jgi:hypothetical protein